jgi:hypothetical protein
LSRIFPKDVPEALPLNEVLRQAVSPPDSLSAHAHELDLLLSVRFQALFPIAFATLNINSTFLILNCGSQQRG